MSKFDQYAHTFEYNCKILFYYWFLLKKKLIFEQLVNSFQHLHLILVKEIQ